MALPLSLLWQMNRQPIGLSRRQLRNLCLVSETKHLASGSECPAKTKDLLRLYSMRFCPFTQRTKLVLAHKCIPHEVVNINLLSKPDWFIKLNPLGAAPTLELNEKVLYESAICNEWLDHVYPGKKLSPADPYERAKGKMLAELFGKVTAAYYKTLGATSKEQQLLSVRNLRLGLRIFEDALRTPFYGGDEVTLVDFHIWPWFERLPLLRAKGFDLTAAEFPRLSGWISNMLQQPSVITTKLEQRLYEAYMQSVADGRTNYDVEV